MALSRAGRPAPEYCSISRKRSSRSLICSSLSRRIREHLLMQLRHPGLQHQFVVVVAKKESLQEEQFLGEMFVHRSKSPLDPQSRTPSMHMSSA